MHFDYLVWCLYLYLLYLYLVSPQWEQKSFGTRRIMATRRKLKEQGWQRECIRMMLVLAGVPGAGKYSDNYPLQSEWQASTWHRWAWLGETWCNDTSSQYLDLKKANRWWVDRWQSLVLWGQVVCPEVPDIWSIYICLTLYVFLFPTQFCTCCIFSMRLVLQ